VTPVRRVAGRSITTLDGLDHAERDAWGASFCATGASQCGFCTSGIIMRFEGLHAKGVAADDAVAVARSLQAPLCRCTGWPGSVDAYAHVGAPPDPRRDLERAGRRATIEGRTPQVVAPEVSLGRAGFADDTAPAHALVALRAADGSWAVGETVAEAREA